MSDLTKSVMLEGSKVSLMELANLDMTAVEEKRGFRFLRGSYNWQVKEGKLDAFGEGENAKPAVIITAVCTQVHGMLQDDPINPQADTAPIGQEFGINFFIKEVADVGRVKAFLSDIGVTGTGTLQDLLNQATGKNFAAPITHRKDKNDADKVYVNVDVSKIKAIA